MTASVDAQKSLMDNNNQGEKTSATSSSFSHGLERTIMAPQVTAKKALASVRSIVNTQKSFVKNQTKGLRDTLRLSSSSSSNKSKQQTANNNGSGDNKKTKPSTTAEDFRQSLKFSPKSFVTKSKMDFEKYYKKGAMLGEGGYGGVYLCTHLETGEQRAVKIVQKSFDQSQNDMVIREFEVLKQLDHPNALKIYALYESELEFYIVTELIEGGELYDMLESEFSEDDVRQILRSILGCMNYCHKLNVVHRDLKPENILLEKNANFSQLKVIDFGLAEFFSSDNEGSDRFTEGVGSSYYMSPQVIQGNYTYKCDIWSCGVIAYVCMGGYAPYSGEDEKETAQIIVDSIDDGGVFFDDPVWDNVSDQCLDFIDYLMTYNEADRPTAEEALKHPWLNAELSLEDASEKRMSTRQSLASLKSFQVEGSKLKQCTYSLIASQILKKEQKEQFQKMFQDLDVNSDGMICENDLISVYRDQFDLELTKDAAMAILLEVNLSASGAISYSEFVIASMLEKGLICERNLEAAFQIMDRNNLGYLCFENLKDVLCVGDDMEHYVNTKIIGPADLDDDGKLSLDDFKSFFIEETEPSLRRSVGPGGLLRRSNRSPSVRSSFCRSSVRKTFRNSANSEDGNPAPSRGLINTPASPEQLKSLAKEKSFRSLMSVFETKSVLRAISRQMSRG